jgi:hypothetical protein
VLKTEDFKLFAMAINRRLGMIISVVAFLVAASVFLPIVWLSSLQWAPHETSSFRITDVQFDVGYLKIAVENLDTQEKTVSEVRVHDLIIERYGFSINRTSTPYVVGVHEPIPVGEEISFFISFNWTSGRAYQIELESADKGWGPSFNVVTP